MKPHRPPAAAPASIITGMTTIAGVPAGSTGARTIALAPQAPSRNWPSAPMFQRRIRKASEQARPVRISGVALTSVSLMTPTLPNAALTMWPNDLIGSPPMSQMMNPLRTKAKARAASVISAVNQRGASVRGSRRRVMGSRSRRSPAPGHLVRASRPAAGHQQADLVDVGRRPTGTSPRSGPRT